ncbi:hypothetical protein [Celeribacter sp. SCSIO 80788]|uniref:hypothetical protein n=1 Tax=Celeribacter sp. SCSIO 80788 TaxID=3117013 RepID=UPI003DA6C93E
MKLYTSDWIGEPKLRLVSRAARSLWMDMLCLMHEAGTGRLEISGRPMTEKELSATLGDNPRTTKKLLAELIEYRVCIIVDGDFIASSRMIKDFKKAEKDKSNGRKGGNPALKIRENDENGVNPKDKTQNPESRNQNYYDDDTRETLTDRERLLEAMGHGSQDCTAGGRIMGNQNDMLESSKWSDDLGLTLDEQCAVIRDVAGKATSQISSFKYFSGPMADYAGRKKQRLEPTEMRVIRGGGRPPPEVDQQTIIRSAAAGTTNKSQEW